MVDLMEAMELRLIVELKETDFSSNERWSLHFNLSSCERRQHK